MDDRYHDYFLLDDYYDALSRRSSRSIDIDTVFQWRWICHFHPIRISGDLKGWALLIGSAIIVHGIATLVWNNHIRYVEASKASILSNLEPFVAMITGLILLAKPITGIELLGAFFIVGGVLLSTYQGKMRFRRTIVSK